MTHRPISRLRKIRNDLCRRYGCTRDQLTILQDTGWKHGTRAQHRTVRMTHPTDGRLQIVAELQDDGAARVFSATNL